MRWIVLGIVLVLACAADDERRTNVSTTTGDEAEERPARGPEGPPVLAEGVTQIEVACEEGAAEPCNALDDDCDGVIDEDESCGAATGPLQITAAWNTGADLDVYLTDPDGETVSFQRREGASGSHLDRSARGSCGPSTQPRVENVVYARRPPAGEYTLELHYLFECEANAGMATATVSISAAGELVGSYNATLSPNDHVEILRFTLPE